MQKEVEFTLASVSTRRAKATGGEGRPSEDAILCPQEKGKKRAIRLMRTRRDKDPILEEQKKREEEEKRRRTEEAESKRKEEEQLREMERKKKEEAAAALEAAKCKVKWKFKYLGKRREIFRCSEMKAGFHFHVFCEFKESDLAELDI